MQGRPFWRAVYPFRCIPGFLCIPSQYYFLIIEFLIYSTMHGQGIRPPCVCAAVSRAALPCQAVPSASSAGIVAYNPPWELPLLWGLALPSFLHKACPCGFIERHVVTNRAMSPWQESSDTLPLRSRCTLFPHIVPVIYLPCVSHIRRHGNSGIPEDSCRCRHIQNNGGRRFIPTDVFERSEEPRPQSGCAEGAERLGDAVYNGEDAV